MKNNFTVRKKCMMSFLVLILIRLCYSIPTPGVNTGYLRELMGDNPALWFLNSLTGNGLSHLSIMTLSIGPYITASIIIQLMTIMIPKLEEMQSGTKLERDRYKKITYITGVVMAIIQAGAMAVGFGMKGLLKTYNMKWVIIITLIWTLTSSIVSWIGNYMNDHQEWFIGNGISLILTSNIVVSYPAGAISIANYVAAREHYIVYAIIAITSIFALFAFTIYINECEKQIKVIYSNKAGGSEGVIPIKLCTAGVVPVIFASSLISFPVMIAGFLKKDKLPIFRLLNTSEWFQKDEPIYTLGVLVFIVLIFVYSYIYTNITFNPIEIARNLQKNGGTIPGIRNGQEATDYIQKETRGIVAIGAICVSIIALTPIIIGSTTGVSNISFLGTSVIIICGVVVETSKQIFSQKRKNHYSRERKMRVWKKLKNLN